jgi:cytochrome c-type biogenesis protein CcmH
LGLALGWMVLFPILARADVLDDGVRRIALQLQCPVCEGQSIADSRSGLAADMRAVIRSKLAAGETDQQILDHFVASYGDSILADPPKRGISLGVWLGPVLAVALGMVALGLLLRNWRRAADRPIVQASEPEPAVAEELHRFREELSR